MTSRNRGLPHAAALRLLVIVVVTACGDAAGLSSEITTSGPSFADITRDGDAWVAETRFYFRNFDYLSIGFDRHVPGTPTSEGIVFLIPGFTGEGSYRLGGATDSTPAGGYGETDASTNTGWGVTTIDGRPGLLRITGFDPTDSTVAGTFRFIVQIDPSRPSTVTTFEGSFRVRPSEQLPAESFRRLD